MEVGCMTGILKSVHMERDVSGGHSVDLLNKSGKVSGVLNRTKSSLG